MVPVLFVALASRLTMQFPANCDVRGAYNATEAPSGTLATSPLGSDLQEVSLLLVPTKLNAGNYNITVTRKAANLYRVDGSNIYLVTRSCFEFSFSQKAVLRYQFASGTLHFE